MPYHVYRNPCDYADGGQWYNVNIDMSKYDGKVERINVTLPHRLIHQIDTIVKVRPEYASRSNFLAEAARKELQKLA
ncbi:DNA-binding protein, CopG family [Yersinia pestis PY-66]|nr:DNA-binding protein, CopG family [Yersinia pestis PY-16]EIS76922.1 DNA-binding protein, CopG family [Yersinia pestis PY-66]